MNGATDGDKVIFKYRDWPAKAKNPYAEILTILGRSGENTAEMHAIVAEFGFDTQFSDALEQEAELLPKKISAEEIAKREDFRKITTFTIDPADAKDFDDALSFQILPNGNIELGVHIADVSHYVTPGDIIDQEAVDRATSVYLVDRVVPMLPEQLSNLACSLRPHEDKFAFSAVFEIDEKGKIHQEWFGKTVMDPVTVFDSQEGPVVVIL